MKTYRKISGVMMEDDTIILKQSIERIRIMEDLIDYNEVNRVKYKIASTTITDLGNSLTEEDVNILYNNIINCTNRDELISILYQMFHRGMIGIRQTKRYNFMNSYSFKILSERKKNNIDESIDTSLAAMVSKVIYQYYKFIIINIKENNNEAYQKLERIYLYNEEGLEDIFTNIKEIEDKNMRIFITSSIKDVIRLQFTKKVSNHLCFDCPLAYTDTCQKVADLWPKHLKDYDFITDGVEVDYEPSDHVEEVVKELTVSGCELEKKSRKNKYKRLGVYKTSNLS